jgi:hypothetical protein
MALFAGRCRLLPFSKAEGNDSMKNASASCCLVILTAILALSAPLRASQGTPETAQQADLSGVHDFDFLNGDWKTHHRRLKERFVSSSEWLEFDGTFSLRPLMAGWGNVGDNVFDMPGGAYRGVSLRAYDPKTSQWLVWWLDGRNPAGGVGPPTKGRFENGVGRFYSEDTLHGKPIRVRVTWTRPTPTTARWEQAFSADGGKTWAIDWVTDFSRAD